MGAPELSYRLAVPRDSEQLLRLIAAYYAHDHIAFDESAAREGLAMLLADGTLGRAYLVELSGQVAGYVLFAFGFDIEFGGRFATVTDLHLEPQFRRTGLGFETLRFVAAECQALGVHALQLEVERDNLAAQALYRKFGFRELTRLPMLKRL
jgi:ribosomal protein S18 acetylase RimI-like enzyme